MSNPVIKVENLSKKYILKHKNSEPYTALRDVISNKVKTIANSKSQILNPKSEEFWALNDVSFEIKQGDRVGIIGRNGAGKSTLLKILSRIVTPTKGRITIEGRVASLLEVGTGFHQELSGRENIFLNGSILGMNKNEIKKKFDEIVDFSGVEKFLDTPVKRYSSGMYVRLAFSIAAHLEPDILIVDEVLAVGDADFQKKCLGKMKDVSGQGRTVLFVSHNIAAVQNLCDKGIYLKQGKVQMIGNVEAVLSSYLKASSEIQQIDLADRKDRSGNGIIHFVSVEVKNENNIPMKSLQCGKFGKIRINFNRKNNMPLNNVHFAFGINDEYGQRIAQFNNEITNQLFSDLRVDTIDIIINKVPFRQGIYSFVLFATVNNEIADWIQDAGTFEVEAGDFYNTGKLPPDGQGNIFIEHSFQLIQP